MSAEASPRPWRVNGHSIEANDPDGLWLQNEKTGRGVVANLPSCPKSRMSVKNRKTWDAIVEANARLIVDAVNERDDLVENLKTANENRERENAEWVKFATALKDERDRLRDIVRRFLDLFTPGTIHQAGTTERLLREARAAIGEVAP